MDKIARIRQEIKRLRKEIKDDKDPLAPNQKAGYLFALADVESFLNTLSEGNERTLFEEIVYPGSFGEFVAGLNPPPKIPKMKVDKDLEEAAEEYALLFEDSTKWKDGGKYKGFIAGAEWQAEKDARDMYMSDNRHYEKVYQLGKKDMKEQMMKEAVESTVENGIFLSNMDCARMGYKLGDKVRIIIVKEE